MFADRQTASRLRACGLLARELYALLATAQRLPGDLSITDLWMKATDTFGFEGEPSLSEVRAALVVLHSNELIGFVSDNAVSYCGCWDTEVDIVLGGRQGSARWPWWGPR